MTSGFTRDRRTTKVVATFESFEAELLRSLAAQLVELLRSEAAAPSSDPLEELFDFSGPTTPPDDPVLARLFPTAYPDDEEAAGDFRRFTEGTLRNGKADNAAAVIDAFDEAGLGDRLGDRLGERPDDGVAGQIEDGVLIDIELDPGGVLAWLRCLTDIRLALATRLGIEDDDETGWRSLDESDPRAQLYDVYQWVGYVQETLVAAAA